MHSGQLMQKASISRDTLRHYIKINLLDPAIDPSNGYKEFSDDDVDLIHFIKNAQKIGFTLAEIHAMTGHMDTAECKHQSLLPYLYEQRVSVNEKVKMLSAIKKHLNELIKDFEKRDCTVKPSTLKL